MKEEEQNACLLIQRWVRASLIRRRLVRMKDATVVIQKYKRMVDCMKYFGKHGSNALVLRRWYRKFQARNDHEKLLAIHRARMEHKAMGHTTQSLIRLQGWFRGLL